jgi:hypothetical protein
VTQIDLWGQDADPGAVQAARVASLSPAQKEILRLARRPAGVTTAEAGRVLHGARDGGRGCRPGRHGAGGTARGGAPDDGRCCPWATSDGWDVLKRLRARGFVDQPAGAGSPYHAVGTT